MARSALIAAVLVFALAPSAHAQDDAAPAWRFGVGFELVDVPVPATDAAEGDGADAPAEPAPTPVAANGGGGFIGAARAGAHDASAPPAIERYEVALGRRLPLATDPELTSPAPPDERAAGFAPDAVIVAIGETAPKNAADAERLFTEHALAGATEADFILRRADDREIEVTSRLVLEHAPLGAASEHTIMVLRDGAWVVDEPTAWRIAVEASPAILHAVIDASLDASPAVIAPARETSPDPARR